MCVCLCLYCTYLCMYLRASVCIYLLVNTTSVPLTSERVWGLHSPRLVMQVGERRRDGSVQGEQDALAGLGNRPNSALAMAPWRMDPGEAAAAPSRSVSHSESRPGERGRYPPRAAPTPKCGWGEMRCRPPRAHPAFCEGAPLALSEEMFRPKASFPERRCFSTTE